MSKLIYAGVITLAIFGSVGSPLPREGPAPTIPI